MPARYTITGLCTAVALAGSGPSLGAQDPLIPVPVRVGHVMSDAERQRTGVARLTPEARVADDGRLTPLAAPAGARLVSAPEGGSYVRLADGTLWEVYLPDRPAADAWRDGDYVAVSRAAAGVGEYDHVLVNTVARTRAFARFVGLASSRRR